MVSASTSHPIGFSAHSCHGSLGHKKVEFFSSNLPHELEISRIGLCQGSGFITCSKAAIVSRICALPDFDDFFWEKNPTPILDAVDNPIHLKNLTVKELKQLAGEIRLELSSVMPRTHKALKASLAVTELTVAMHYVFHAPLDKILWDVGEQTYAHKILTGRRSLIHTLRQKDGISGYTSRSESEYDPFSAGHGCNSISAGLGRIS